MHLLKITFLLLLSILLLNSCSDDEDKTTLSQDPIIGLWEGVVSQPDYGTLDISINITTTLPSSKSGNVSYVSNDLSQCNDAIFVCAHITCSGSWIFNEKIGSTYKFKEAFASGSDCVNGFVELSLSGNDKLNYSWIEDFSDPLTASGTLERKK